MNTVAEAEAIRKLEEQWTAAFKNKGIDKITRAELSKLIAQQAHMIRRSTEYVADKQRIRELRIIINQHNHDLNTSISCRGASPPARQRSLISRRSSSVR